MDGCETTGSAAGTGEPERAPEGEGRPKRQCTQNRPSYGEDQNDEPPDFKSAQESGDLVFRVQDCLQESTRPEKIDLFKAMNLRTKVSKSKIEGAGNGLFTRQKVEKGSLLGVLTRGSFHTIINSKPPTTTKEEDRSSIITGDSIANSEPTTTTKEEDWSIRITGDSIAKRTGNDTDRSVDGYLYARRPGTDGKTGRRRTEKGNNANHSSDPNADLLQVVDVKRNKRSSSNVLLILAANKPIDEGEEVTVSYGQGVEESWGFMRDAKKSEK